MNDPVANLLIQANPVMDPEDLRLAATAADERCATITARVNSPASQAATNAASGLGRPQRPKFRALGAFAAAFGITIAAISVAWLVRTDEPAVNVVDSVPPITLVSTTLPPTTMSSTTVPAFTVLPTTVPPAIVPAPDVVPFPPSELAVLEVPLSEAVPGFSDTIVMRTWSGDGDGVMRWRSSESMTELLLRPDDNFGFGDLDASARWVGLANAGVVQAVPTVPGEPSQREIVGYDAPGGVVWHNTEPGHLAWLECPYPFDGSTTLYTLDVSDPSADPIRVRSFDQGCRLGSWGVDEPSVTLGRWGSTGVWVTKYSGLDWEMGAEVIESVLVDAGGAEIAMVSDARMIAMSPDGTSVWQSDDSEGQYFVLSPDGQQRSPVPGFDGEHLGGAWWSPDGTRLAMWLPGILRTVDSVSGEVITEIAEPALDAWGPRLAWSTDSRFLVYKELPFPQNPDDNAVLVIHDTATNTTTKIPLTQDVGDIRLR